MLRNLRSVILGVHLMYSTQRIVLKTIDNIKN